MEPRPVRIGLRIFSLGVMAFLYIPLVVITVYLLLVKQLGAFEAL